MFYELLVKQNVDCFKHYGTHGRRQDEIQDGAKIFLWEGGILAIIISIYMSIY